MSINQLNEFIRIITVWRYRIHNISNGMAVDEVYSIGQDDHCRINEIEEISRGEGGYSDLIEDFLILVVSTLFYYL